MTEKPLTHRGIGYRCQKPYDIPGYQNPKGCITFARNARPVRKQLINHFLEIIHLENILKCLFSQFNIIKGLQLKFNLESSQVKLCNACNKNHNLEIKI